MATISAEHQGFLALYRKSPRGFHPDDLIEFVKDVRRKSGVDNLMIVAVRPHRAWRVARMTRGNEPDIQFVDERTYADIDDAEWSIFQHCWRIACGEDLAERHVDGDDASR